MVYTELQVPVVNSRSVAVLIGLCLLVGIVGFLPVLTGAEDSPTGLNASSAPTTGTPTPNGSSITATVTPAVTTTDPVGDSSDDSPGSRPPTLASTVTTVRTTPSATTIAASTTERTPTVTHTRTPDPDPTPKVTLAAPDRVTTTVTLSVKDEVYAPANITVPAGSRVTIVFENRDTGVEHSVIIYDDGGMSSPVFTGREVEGPGTVTETFTAPSKPGAYALGCGVPGPHRKGTFTVV
jgi:plastocyanin